MPSLVLAGAFGTTSGLLMAEGLAVRPLGAAFAFTALTDDEASLHVNPAGLARLEGFAVGGGHVLGLLDTRISYLDLAYSVPSSGAVGLQASYFGDSQAQRDGYGVQTGTINSHQMLLGLGLAKELAPGWRVGLQAKGLQEEYAGSASTSVAGDVGLQGPLPRGWRFGLAVLNAGQQQAASGRNAYGTPMRVQGGLALPLFTPAWKLEMDLQGLPQEQQVRALVGTELKVDLATQDQTLLALRGGTQVGFLRAEDSRLYLGAGVELPPNYALDYALLNLGSLGMTHRFSLSLRFQGARATPGPVASALAAPYGLKVTEQYDGLLVTWADPNERVSGYNLYSDYGVLAERLTPKPVVGRAQKFVKVTKSRSYSFYVRPVGSDGQEGPASEVVLWVVK